MQKSNIKKYITDFTKLCEYQINITINRLDNNIADITNMKKV